MVSAAWTPTEAMLNSGAADAIASWLLKALGPAGLLDPHPASMKQKRETAGTDLGTRLTHGTPIASPLARHGGQARAYFSFLASFAVSVIGDCCNRAGPAAARAILPRLVSRDDISFRGCRQMRITSRVG